MSNRILIFHFAFKIQLLSTKGKQFNEDVMEKYSEVDPGQEVRIIDQEHLEKPFQVTFVSGKVCFYHIFAEQRIEIIMLECSYV